MILNGHGGHCAVEPIQTLRILSGGERIPFYLIMHGHVDHPHLTGHGHVVELTVVVRNVQLGPDVFVG